VGTVVSLDSKRQPRIGAPARRVQVYVDLACPFSYLTAERIHRAFSRVTWRLASNASVDRRDPAADPARRERVIAAAAARAAELHIPLQWPERFPSDTPAAMRAASLAIDRGRGGEFILAAGRLAFAGGFDLEHPEILAEAAAAAQIDLDECLFAARDERRDDAIEAASLRLLQAGVERLPALRVDRMLLSGERRISAYLAAGPARQSAAIS
jgi:predicted DsbA family dithiol-disulfide isomerase